MKAFALQLVQPVLDGLKQVAQVLWQEFTMQLPLLSMVKPEGQEQTPSDSTAFDLQLVHDVEAEFVQVLQVKWQPMITQFPVAESTLYPELHLQEPSVWRAELALQVWQLKVFPPTQVLQVLWQSWHCPVLSA